MSSYLIITFIIVGLSFPFIFCADCSSSKTCSDCISFPYDVCVWCSAENHEGERCQSKKTTEQHQSWCSDVIYDPQNKYEILGDNDFSAGENGIKVTQIKPQSIKIKARPGITVPIDISYKPAKDYPLDVYYLIDFSFTMKDHSRALKEQGQEIYRQLKTLTNNVRLGIGSFVDKNALPFADPNSQNSYSFRNRLSLTDDVQSFVDALTDPDGENYDVPEGSLDALMQTIVCKEVDWRDEARRIIVLSTDAQYHSAGEGKFVGAIKPHDMKCHLIENQYSESLSFDYPSSSQINKVALENNVNIIFAVSEKAKKYYDVLNKQIYGSSSVLLSSSSDAANMITNQYLMLIRNVELDSDAPSFIKLDMNCSSGRECEVRHNEVLQVKASLSIKYCPEKRNQFYSFNIGPKSLSEKLNVNVEIDCECDCEKNTASSPNSPKCSNAGTYQCGICKCNENRNGEFCQCSGTEIEGNLSKLCKTNENDTNVCSGRGYCKCGICEECKPGYSGKFCEFDDSNCLASNGLPCAGHGTCKYGKCICDKGWINNQCSCPDNESCKAPYSDEICFGNGDCDCGVCKCKRKSTGELCTGKFCDDCDQVTLKRCRELEGYAYCNYVEHKEDCDKKYNQSDSKVIFMNRTEINAVSNKKWCKKTFENGTALIFRFSYEERNLELVLQKELEVPPAANIWIPIGSSIGAVLLIGLLTLLLWKCLIDMYDRKEYEKFAADSSAAGYEVNTNVLYQDPCVHFTNPSFQNS